MGRKHEKPCFRAKSGLVIFQDWHLWQNDYSHRRRRRALSFKTSAVWRLGFQLACKLEKLKMSPNS
ncbi:hypothetical protein Plhal304r1_c097g0174061 [Plasmopara halstedii]